MTRDRPAETRPSVAILFVLGFLSAGLTAPYIGTLADKHGRRLLCLTFCVTYALSCATKMVNSIALLSFGRLLGGVSTSILFSVFESWMVSTAKSKGMPSSDLGGLLGRCTLVNGLVASTSGLVSDGVVAWTGTFKAPFVASGLLLVLAGLVIRKTWSENYGSREERAGEESRPLIKALRVLIESTHSGTSLSFPLTMRNRRISDRFGCRHDLLRDDHVPFCLYLGRCFTGYPKHRRSFASARHHFFGLHGLHDARLHDL